MREVASGHTPRLPREKVEVDGERLQAGEPRVALIEGAPPRLGEPDRWIFEDTEDAPEDIARRHEVRVEDRDERSVGESQSVSKGACLVAIARAAPHVVDLHSLEAPHS